RGGFVLTGGTMKMEGAIDLVQDVFHSDARIAIPNYIGVREPQYTAAVGTILFAEKNAKLQGKDLEPSVVVQQPIDAPTVKKNRQQAEPKEKKESKVGNLFKYFFE